MSKLIWLYGSGKGFATVVDDEDYDELAKYRWHLLKSRQNWYVRRDEQIDKKSTCFLMHRVIMAAPLGLQIDHRNRYGLDNRRSNLRLCTNAENNQNRGMTTRNTSGYTGVRWNEHAGKWESYIMKHDKKIHLGIFSDLEDAINARRIAKLELHPFTV